MLTKTLTKALILIPITVLLITSVIYAFEPHGGSVETAIPQAEQLNSWTLGEGGGNGFLGTSTVQSLSGQPSIQFGSIFSNVSTRVFITLNLKQSLNLSREGYLLFWLFADRDLNFAPNSFYARFNAPFHFFVTLISADGSNKTYGDYPILWQDWRQFALPLYYRGVLVGGTPENPNYGGVNESSRWRDTQSLQKIEQIQFYFLGDPNFEGNIPHYLYLTELRSSRYQFSSFEGVNAVISAVAVFSVLLLGPIYAIRFIRLPRKPAFLSALRDFFYGFEFPEKYAKLFVVIILIKAVLAVLTPLSSDFIDDLRQSLPLQPNNSPLGASPLFGGYMVGLRFVMYELWLLLPVDHVNILQIFPGNYFSPFPDRGIFNFTFTPGSFLLIVLLKIPNIVADLAIAVVIYKTVLRVVGSHRAANAGTLLWLVNPYNTLLIEMWSNFDVLFVLPLMLSVYFLTQGRTRSAASFLGLSIGVRIWAAVLLPLFLAVLPRFPKQSDNRPSTSRFMLTFIAYTACFALIAITPFLLSNLLRGVANPRITYGDTRDISFFLGQRLQLFNLTTLITVAVIVVYLFALHDWWKPRREELPSVILIFFLILFTGAYWFPHWLVWIMPFIALDYGLNGRNIAYPLLLTLSALASVIVRFSFYFATWGSSFLFFPASNSDIAGLSLLLSYLGGNPILTSLQYIPLVQSAFVGTLLAYLLRIYRDMRMPR